MIESLRNNFSTIRWKLTGAFLAVALLLALTMIVIFLGAIIFFLNNGLIPQAVAEAAGQYAAAVSNEYADPDGSPEELIESLRQITLAEPPPPPPPGTSGVDGGGEVTIDELMIVLLDSYGRVITTTGALDYRPGQALGELEPEPAGAILSQALRGITDTARLSGWTELNHQPIGAAPVFAPDGSVAGAVYVRVTDFPAVGLFLSNLTPFLITFILPWLCVSGGLGAVYAWVMGRGFARRLGSLAQASAALAGGDLSRRVDDSSPDEIGQLGRQFDSMAAQLADSMRSLRLLADRNAQLAEQAAQLAAVEERNRLARDLHDSVSQELFSLTMLAAATRRVLTSQPEQAAAQLLEIEASARRALEETRSLIFALRPAALDGRGLAPALRDLAVALGERQGFQVELRILGERRLPLEVEQALFRITQEALANVSRHSGVRAASVELVYGEELISLTIGDQGRGFDPANTANSPGIGLHTMAERAEDLGGSFTLESAPGAGTTILVRLPVADRRQEAGVTGARGQGGKGARGDVGA